MQIYYEEHGDVFLKLGLDGKIVATCPAGRASVDAFNIMFVMNRGADLGGANRIIPAEASDYQTYFLVLDFKEGDLDREVVAGIATHRAAHDKEHETATVVVVVGRDTMEKRLEQFIDDQTSDVDDFIDAADIDEVAENFVLRGETLERIDRVSTRVYSAPKLEFISFLGLLVLMLLLPPIRDHWTIPLTFWTAPLWITAGGVLYMQMISILRFGQTQIRRLGYIPKSKPGRMFELFPTDSFDDMVENFAAMFLEYRRRHLAIEPHTGEDHIHSTVMLPHIRKSVAGSLRKKILAGIDFDLISRLEKKPGTRWMTSKAANLAFVVTLPWLVYLGFVIFSRTVM